MRLIKGVCVFLGLALLAGCATRYQPESYFSGGYSEIKTGKDTFIVTFKGNGNTSNERAMRYALMRASELAVQNGYPYFSVVSKVDNSKSYTRADTYGNASENVNSYQYRHAKGKSARGSHSTSTVISTVTRPSLNLTVKCYKGKPEGIEFIDARYYLENNPR